MTARKPWNVMYVENGIGYGGAAICLRHLVRNLDREQYNPLVITGRTGPNYEEIATESAWKHIPDRRVDVVGMKRTLSKATWPDKIPGLRFIANQFLARLDDVANFLPLFIQTWWTAKQFKPDIIHVNNEPLCNRASILVGKAMKIPVVCHVRGDQDGSRLMHKMYQLPDRFIPVSHWVSNSMGNLGVPERKRTVIYDGIGLEALDLNADGNNFRQQYGIPKESFAVGLVGLIIPWKGQNDFITAAAELRDKIPNLCMALVGGTPEECGPYEAELRQRVKDEGLEDLIVFTGHVNNMPEVYNGLDVAVSASTSPEPLGTMVIETMAMARPLIAPNHGGGAEMGDHDETALLYEPRNAQDLAKMILRFYEEPETRERLRQNAREKALKTFAVAEHVRQVQDLYQEELGLKERDS